ncbi:MAG: TIGR03617 family F420-dependent LLM class oxidoreductase, partial [Steroidobacteraceae bacterium]|nr:TIGR03617 family F420-dependent LLM class oxidoreductase [Steroidobacteraceae bacterium]
AVAFGKSPYVMALGAYSFNQFVHGRFSLGLGSQIRPHIERRYGMPWTDKPAVQMREYVHASHAIWDAFEDGKPLKFEGQTYRHTLMTPEFAAYNAGYGRPRVLIGAVGPGMTDAAVDVADGLITHSFVSEKSLREINYPRILERLKKHNKPRSAFEIQLPLFIVTGSTAEEFDKNLAWHRHRIGFYASTPAYKIQLDLFGWGEVHDETRRLTREGRWDELGRPITDEMLQTFAVIGEPKEIAPKIKQRFGDFIDTIQSNLELQDEEIQYRIIKDIEAI